MKKFFKYTLRTIAVIIGLIIILIAAAFIYVGSHKQEIIGKVKKELAERLSGDVQIGNIDLNFTQDFPNISILIENVSIKDTMFNLHKHPFFQAEKVYGILSITHALQKDNPLTGIMVEKGQLYIYTDTAGYTNTYLFSPKKTTDTTAQPSSAKTVIERIRLKDFRVVLNDEKKNKLYDFDVKKLSCKIKTADSVLTFNTSNDIIIHSLAFNTLQGSYVKETPFEGDFEIKFDKGKKQLSFADIDVTLKEQPFKLSGEFNFTEAPTFALKVFSKKLDYKLAQSLVTPKIAVAFSLVQLDKPVVEVAADISGPLKGGEPLVKANWVIKETKVTSAFVSLSNCSMSGSYINEVVPGQPRLDPNSELHFKKLTGVYEGIPVASENVYIDNLITPMVKCDVKADFELSKLNDLLGSRTLHLHEGTGHLDITYAGPLEKNTSQNSVINGKLAISNGLLVYHPREVQMKNVSCNILFKNTDVYVTAFKGNVQGNKIMMTGAGKNLLAIIKDNPGKLFIDWNIYSPSLNLNSLTSFIKKRASVAPAAKSKLGSTARQLDEIVTYSNFRLNVKADEVLYSKFKATNVKATMMLKDEDWLLKNISLEHAGGQMNINGSLSEKTAQVYEANIKMNMENVDVNKVMYAFSNFGQSGIESDNLRGKLTTAADIKFDIDRNTEKPSDIKGYFDFSLKNGALLHYEPLKKVQSIIFKKRNFEEVYFAELKNRIEINGKDITFNRMEIQSTALTLFVDGVYNLDKGNTDISIQVPLSNLKKRTDEYQPENLGTDKKGGASIYLRGRTGKDGTVAFKLDVFKKLRKNRNKKDKTEAPAE